MTSLPHNNNIHKGPPQINPLGLYGGLKVALDIPLFGFFDLFDGFRKIRIIWRDESGLDFFPQFPEFSIVNTQVLFAQWTYTEQLNVPLEPIVQHGQFIQPGLSHEFTPPTQPEIILEFSALLKLAHFIDIFLKIFGVGIHGPEFVNSDLITVCSRSFQLNERSV